MKAKKNSIYIGSLTEPDYYYENTCIVSANTIQNVALVGQELTVDEFNPVVAESYAETHNALLFRSSDGEIIETGDGSLYAIDVTESESGSGIINVAYGTPLWYYHDGELVGKFYVESVKRNSKNQYQIKSISAIGLLSKMYTGGGMFLSTTFKEVLDFVLAAGLHGTGSAVINYTIDDDVANLTVSGYIPYCTKRNALYYLIFANGVNIVKDYEGNPRFTFVYSTTNTSSEIDSGDIYYGGSVEYDTPYSKVELSEHTYSEDTTVDAVTLYDNSTGSAASNEEVWFDAPVIESTLATTGTLTISSHTVNSAIVSGTGTLTGIQYTHTTRTVSKTNPNASEQKVVSVTDCTLVNTLNSDNLLNRLYAFYCPEEDIRKITNSIKFTDQRCGKAYKFKNPFGETVTAYLSSMDSTFSAVGKSNCEFYVDYVPAGQAGLYDHVDVIIPEDGVYTGTWTVPEGVTQFKVVLIGGGTGGTSGYAGANGKDATCYTDISEGTDISAMYYGAEGGAGGAGGTGGNAGKALEFTVENAVSGTEYTYTLGTGGAGGAATGIIPDTVDELRSALAADDPDTEYTDAEIQALIDSKEKTGWTGSPNAGADGTASTISDGTTTWSTSDSEAYVPDGGVYDPINSVFYAYKGRTGTAGGHGGARQISNNGTAVWDTTGEDVNFGDVIYKGGSTGSMMTSISDLPEASLLAYGGNGAGAAVGISRTENPHINGASDQTASWEVKEDDS